VEATQYPPSRLGPLEWSQTILHPEVEASCFSLLEVADALRLGEEQRSSHPHGLENRGRPETDGKALHAEVSFSLYWDVAAPSGNDAALYGDTAALRRDAAALHRDAAALRRDAAALRTDAAALRSDVGQRGVHPHRCETRREETERKLLHPEAEGIPWDPCMPRSEAKELLYPDVEEIPWYPYSLRSGAKELLHPDVEESLW
jgi:hypothetical protein